MPPPADDKEEEKELNVSKEFQQRKKWLSSMNDLWKKEYLHQVLGSQGEVWTTKPNPLKEREVVLVADDREKRLNWKMGVTSWKSVLKQTISHRLQVPLTVLMWMMMMRYRTVRWS